MVIKDTKEGVKEHNYRSEKPHIVESKRHKNRSKGHIFRSGLGVN